MAKEKAVVSSVDPSSSSDDTDDLIRGKTKNNINKFLSGTPIFNSKKRQLLKKELNQDVNDNKLMPSFLKREHTDKEEGTSESETECGNVKTVKQVIKNVPSKISRKLQKKKKEDIYNSNSSEEGNISNRSLHSSNRHSIDKPKIKIKKEKGKISQKYESATESINENSENEHMDRNSIKQTKLHIKKEVVSDDAESSSEESVRDSNNSSELINNRKTVIKNEVQSNPSSDYEDGDDKILNAREPTTEHSIVHTSPSVTILQDIRLTPKCKSAKEKLKETYPGLKPIEITSELVFSDSDEIHLFRIPKNVDAKLLKHAKINLEEQCKVDIGEKYIITPTTRIPDPALVISANTSVLMFKNNIKMEKYIKSKAEPNIPVPERKSVPLPENLKKRHPLFGSDFKQKIRLSEHVEKKLDEAIANLLKRERKSKKKKEKKNKHKEKEDKSNQEILDLFNPQNFLTNYDRMKKETSDDSAFGSLCSTDKLRSKKKDKGHTSDKSTEQESLPEKELSERKKEKKKNKHSCDREWLDVSGIKKEVEDIDTVDAVNTEQGTSTSPKKRKKNASIINSTLMSDVMRTPQFKCEVSTIVSEASSGKKSKKSKKDRTSKDESSIKKELISELLNEATMKISGPKKIKMEF